ncbi:MAG: hypothetical protein JSR28_14240, partial [Proteobacteria bacterium]|nr:hypothetical protein [Pseudomonadota bacterium]
MTGDAAPRSGAPPFLRIPPFPRSRFAPLARSGSIAVDPHRLADLLRRERVGGRFWGQDPVLPAERRVVLAPDDAVQLRSMLDREDRAKVVVLASAGLAIDAGIPRIAPDCDLWRLVEGAERVRAGANHELALVAGLSGTALEVDGLGPFRGAVADPAEVAASVIGAWRYVCPFNDEEISADQAIAGLGQLRRLLDGNRDIDAVLGVARWKRATLDALLWDGAAPVPHVRKLPRGGDRSRRVLAWKSRASRNELAWAEAHGCNLGELEDGFIRSAGLGANCVPPLSAIVDWDGIYFDPARSSGLEQILKCVDFDQATLDRAAALRARVVRSAISKYEQGGSPMDRPADSRRRVLVTGQVEDDRSIISGGGAVTNRGLLERARTLEPDAWIIYKPHPDVEAGHRKGHLADREVLAFADAIERTAPIASLLDTVDGVHVITSLTGFEALMRGKAVTTHGIPFYAGWGLTRDLAAVPARRGRRRTLD